MEYIQLFVSDIRKPELLGCRICLAIDVKLLCLQNKLAEYYEEVTGLHVSSDMLPQHVCEFCAALLRRAAEFRARSLRTHSVLLDYVAKYGKLTREHLQQLGTKHTYGLHVTNVETIVDIISEDVQDYIQEDRFYSPQSDIEDVTVKEEHVTNAKEHDDMNKVDREELNRTPEVQTVVMKRKGLRKVSKCIRKTTEKDSSVFNSKLMKKSPEEYEEFAKEHECDLIQLRTREQKIAVMEGRKETERYKEAEFKCELCCTGFTTEKTYKKHDRCHNPKSGSYVCEVCYKRYKTGKLLSRHKGEHRVMLTCKRCGKITYNTTNAKLHYLTHLGTTYDCRFCGKVFDRQKSMLEHSRLKHAIAPCPLCYEKFLDSGLHSHMAFVHRETFKCASCDTVFATEAARELHQTTAPKGECEKITPCARCGEPLPTESELKAHISTAHKRLPRPPPKKIYRIPKSTRTRVKRKCTCESGGVACACGAQPLQPGENTFICEICAVGNFQSLSALKVHQRIHTGEKPYHCPSCPKTFRIKFSLQAHVRTHTGDRPYECSECGKAFKTWTARRRHQTNVHKNVRRFLCHLCDKPFQTRSNVQLHVNSVHLKIPNKPRIRNRRPRASPLSED